MRFVVCSLGGEGSPWSLPASIVERDRPWIHGGERTLYELATALAAMGHMVELRGAISEMALRELADAAGARPLTGLEARRPIAEDVVIVPEGYDDPLPYGRVALSPARAILLLLAPPGLFGWPFAEGWMKPDPLAVSPDDVARPEHFQAMRSLGFTLWTHSGGIEERARAAGVPCTLIGTGQPLPFPEAADRTHDLAYLEDNRWAAVAREIVAGLDATVLPIPTGSRQDVLRQLARARILVFPSRLEGTARVQLEARAVGTVPVALNTNPFAAGLDDAGGARVVGSVEEMPDAVRRLLGNEDELTSRSERAMRTARDQLDWNRFLTRLSRTVPWLEDSDPGRGARSEIGNAIDEAITAGEAVPAGELDRLSEERDRALLDLERVQNRRSVRLVTRLADMTRPLRRSPRTPSGPSDR